MSLKFLLQVLVGRKPEQQSPDEWKAEVKKRLKPPTMSLRNYGGGELNIVSEIQCKVSHGSYSKEAVLQVQNNAPVNVLLGTDLQPHLGFALIQLNGSQPHVNLLPLQGNQAASEANSSATRVEGGGASNYS